MPITIKGGKVLFRQWNRSAGLTETIKPFSTLEELYALCLEASNPELVDRIIIMGENEAGQPHTLTFAFQSISNPEK